MTDYPATAVERAMKVQEVIFHICTKGRRGQRRRAQHSVLAALGLLG